MKKLVYWGIGKVGKDCLKYYPEKVPELIIDSNCIDKEWNGIPICKPESVTDWKSLFVVITVVRNAPIKKFLKKKGLIENIDFQDCQFFFNIHSENVEENILRLSNTVSENSDLANRTLILVNVFTIRQADVFINFLNQYAEKKKCVLVMWWGVIPENQVYEKLKFPVFCRANIPYPEGENQETELVDKTGEIILSGEELIWIKELANRKQGKKNEQLWQYLLQEYQYQKKIIEIFKPREVVVWGGWAYGSSIYGYLCEKYHIPYGYMEYGWLPGTYQVEPRGFAGLGESVGLPNPETDVDFQKIDEIKQYIISHKLDSNTFSVNLEDEEKFCLIDDSKKTVFLVGMDDYGMAINPDSAYWKEYISSAVSSTKEAYEICKKICKKYHWNFIFKPHPNSERKNEIADADGESIMFQNMQIDKLIETADVAVSIASAVNYKVLLYDTPLVQIGFTTLTGKECCYEAKTKEQIEDNLVRAIEQGVTRRQRENFDRHLSMLLNHYLWDDLSEREVRYGLTFDRDFPLR